MRFNKRVTFVTELDSYYDPSLGDYVEGDKESVTVPCNVSSLRIDRTNQLFGDIDTSVQVVRLQRPYEHEFDYIELNGKRQTIRQRSDYRKGVFYLERDRVGN